MKTDSYIQGGSNGQRFVIGAGETLDDAQASGQWIASEKVVYPEDWR